MEDAASSEQLITRNERGIAKPLFRNGRYENPPWPTFTGLPGASDFFRWRWDSLRGESEGGGSKVPWDKPDILDEEIPMHKPSFSQPPDSKHLSITWIGHASVVTQIDGFTIICDPIWSQRCSPVPCAGPKRYRQPPCEISELPRPDVAVISHNHYDHLDKATVRKLEAEFGGKDGMDWVVPAGLGSWMRSNGNCTNVHELSWGEELSLTSKVTGAKGTIVCLPAQHWSTRTGAFDRNLSLWSGWGFLGQFHRFFFAGDTGYTPEFEAIGKAYGPFDLAAIPIGCYCPRNFMRTQHTDPEGSVKIHQNIRAKKSLGMHWGTFEMGSTEHYLAPRSDLRKEVEKAGLSVADFKTTGIGETWNIFRQS